jgi:hypothetical protein
MVFSNHYGGTLHMFIIAKMSSKFEDLVDFRGFLTPNFGNPDISYDWYSLNSTADMITEQLHMKLAIHYSRVIPIDIDTHVYPANRPRLRSYPFYFSLPTKDINPDIAIIMAGNERQAEIPIHKIIPAAAFASFSTTKETPSPLSVVRILSPTFGMYDDIDHLAATLYHGVQYHLTLGITETVYYCRPHVVAAGLAEHPLIQSIQQYLTIVRWDAVVSRRGKERVISKEYYDQLLVYNHASFSFWQRNKLLLTTDQDEYLAIPGRRPIQKLLGISTTTTGGKDGTVRSSSSIHSCLKDITTTHGCFIIPRRAVYPKTAMNYVTDPDPVSKLILRSVEEYTLKKKGKNLFWPDAMQVTAVHDATVCAKRDRYKTDENGSRRKKKKISWPCIEEKMCTPVDEKCVFLAHYMDQLRKDGLPALDNEVDRDIFAHGIIEDTSWINSGERED